MVGAGEEPNPRLPDSFPVPKPVQPDRAAPTSKHRTPPATTHRGTHKAQVESHERAKTLNSLKRYYNNRNF